MVVRTGTVELAHESMPRTRSYNTESHRNEKELSANLFRIRGFLYSQEAQGSAQRSCWEVSWVGRERD